MARVVMSSDPLRIRWLGTVPYREALAVQQALFDRGEGQHLLLLEHPHVFTYGPRCRPGAQPALRPGRGRRRSRRRPARRRHHVPRAGPARRLSDRRRWRNRLGAAEHVRNVEQLVIDTLAAFGVVGGAARRLPGRVGRRRRSRAAQDLRHRRAPQAGPHDARLRPQRRDRHDVPARAHRRLRHRRPAGDIAGRGGRRRPDAARSSTSSPASPPSAGATVAAERQDVAWQHRPDDLSLFSRGAGPGRAACGSCPRLAAAGGHVGVWRSRRSEARRGCGRRSTTAPRCSALKRTDARPRAGHRVRGRRVPEPVGVLGRRHGHVHGARRALHAGVRVLPRRHPQAGGAGSRRAGARRRGHRPGWVSTTPC